MTWPESVRELVSARASWKCEYCLLDQADAGLPHEIDHVISRKHGGTGAIENLAYACYLCNRYKGSDIASLHASFPDRFLNLRVESQTASGLDRIRKQAVWCGYSTLAKTAGRITFGLLDRFWNR